MLKKLHHKFQTIEDAETSYGITYYNDGLSHNVVDESLSPGEIMSYVTANFVI